MPETADHHVEVEVTDPIDVLGDIDRPQIGDNADTFQVFDKGKGDAIDGGALEQKDFKLKGLAVLGHHTILGCPAGLAQQPKGVRRFCLAFPEPSVFGA